jgi:hypothetical protein
MHWAACDHACGSALPAREQQTAHLSGCPALPVALVATASYPAAALQWGKRNQVPVWLACWLRLTAPINDGSVLLLQPPGDILSLQLVCKCLYLEEMKMSLC